MTATPIQGSYDPSDLGRDPAPYVDPVTGVRQARPGYLTTVYKPRREYQVTLHHPHNPALADLRERRNREVYVELADPSVFYRGMATLIEQSDQYSDGQKLHAKRVAQRLANLA